MLESTRRPRSQSGRVDRFEHIHRRRAATSATTWEYCGTKSARALPQESRSGYRTSWNWKVKRKFSQILAGAIFMSLPVWELSAIDPAARAPLFHPSTCVVDRYG